MRLKIWLLIWIFTDQWKTSILPKLANKNGTELFSLLSVFTENPDTRESQLSAPGRYLVTILRMWQFISLLYSARHLARISQLLSSFIDTSYLQTIWHHHTMLTCHNWTRLSILGSIWRHRDLRDLRVTWERLESDLRVTWESWVWPE